MAGQKNGDCSFLLSWTWNILSRLTTRIFLFLNFTFLSLGYTFAFLSFTPSITLFFYFPDFYCERIYVYIYIRIYTYIYIYTSKNESGSILGLKKLKKGKNFYLKVFLFNSFLLFVYSLHSGYGFLVVYICLHTHKSYTTLAFTYNLSFAIIYTLPQNFFKSFNPNGISLI